MMRSLAALVLALGWLVPQSSAVAAERAFALVIGNNVPPPPPAGDGLLALQFADDDALRYADLFGRFADDVHLLTVLDGTTRSRFPDRRVHGVPTLGQLRSHLTELNAMASAAASAGDDVTFFLVFSGHGAVDANGEAFLSLLDGPLSRSVLYDEILGTLTSDHVHVIIDACHAGGVVGLRGNGRFDRSVDAQVSDVPPGQAQDWVRERTLERFPHVGVLAAATAGEQAHEWSEIESGVFSHEVLSALWGAADVNGDLAIEYSEVQAFVAAANSGLADPRARPTVVARAAPADPHAPLIRLKRLERVVWVSSDAKQLGQFHVDLADGRRHLDANVGTGVVTFAVPAELTTVVRHVHGEYELLASSGTRLNLDGRNPKPSEARPRGATSAGYRRGLFANPYTPEYYKGFVDSIGAPPVRFRETSARISAPRLRATATEPHDTGPHETPRDSQRRSAEPGVHRHRLGIAATVLAATAGATAVSLGAVAGKARADFVATDIEKEAHRLDAKHRKFVMPAVGVGVASVALLVAAVVLLRKR